MECSCKDLFPAYESADKSTKEPTYYIDIKSELLRDTLRVVLQNVRGISLAQDMLSVWQILVEIARFPSSKAYFPRRSDRTSYIMSFRIWNRTQATETMKMTL